MYPAGLSASPSIKKMSRSRYLSCLERDFLPRQGIPLRALEYILGGGMPYHRNNKTEISDCCSHPFACRRCGLLHMDCHRPAAEPLVRRRGNLASPFFSRRSCFCIGRAGRAKRAFSQAIQGLALSEPLLFFGFCESRWESAAHQQKI